MSGRIPGRGCPKASSAIPCVGPPGAAATISRPDVVDPDEVIPTLPPGAASGAVASVRDVLAA